MERYENTVENGEKAVIRHLSPFPTMSLNA